jgi:nicotinamidase-related amidase
MKALMVIDVQNGMFLEEDPVFEGDRLLRTLNGLLAKARAANVPVFYVQHKEAAGQPLEYGTKGWEIHPAIFPEQGDVIIHKTTPDSFYNTALKEELEKLGITQLYLTGIQTEVCVDTTCRRAFSMGYKVTLVSDAHSTWASNELSAQQIISHHNGVLRWFADLNPSCEIGFD